MKNIGKAKAVAFVLGLTSMTGQIVLLRELVTVFYGNEIAYAVILGCWLFWISCGSFLATHLFKGTTHMSAWGSIVGIQVILSGMVPATVILARSLRTILDISPGEMIGMMPMLVSSFVLLAPLTFLLGALYTCVCRYVQEQREEGSVRGISSIYLWEGAGATAGGMLYTFFLIHFIPAVPLSFLIGLCQIAVIFLWVPLRAGRDRLYAGMGIFLLVSLAAAIVMPSGMISRLDKNTMSLRWPGYKMVAAKDSIYGSIVIVKREEEYSLFENGLHSFTTNDALTAEQNVQYAMLVHPHPRNILLIGSGLAGEIDEILKYPVTGVDYVQLDPDVIRLSRRYIPSDKLSNLDDERVNVLYMDARLFVKKTDKKYDVVIVGLPDPYTALLNRYYSLEFFREVDRILNPQSGVFSVSVSSSENYLSREAKDFLRTIHSTLKKVFVQTASVPGDVNIFLASNKEGTIDLHPENLIERLKTRNIQTRFVSEAFLPFTLSRQRLADIHSVLQQGGQVNTDAHPVGYLYDLVLWSTHFDAGFKNFINALRPVQPPVAFLFCLGFLICGLYAFRRFPSFPVSLSVMTTGFSEIVYQLIVIIAFQTLYGYAYYKIGLILTSFMAGLVLGSWKARSIIGTPGINAYRVYINTQLLICLYPLLLPWMFVWFRNLFDAPRFIGVFATVFAALPIVAGFLGGLQYPLAMQLVSQGTASTAKTAGFLYAADVLGAMAGALLAGMILIPLWGVGTLAYFCAALNAVVFLLLIRFKKGKIA